jgi:glycerol-3-phosphate acyltransferase PlsY
MSLGSVLGAATGAVAMLLLALIGPEPWEYALYVLIGVPLVVARHSDNFARLVRGEERKLGKPGEELQTAEGTE